jgi:hypothetical protein
LFGGPALFLAANAWYFCTARRANRAERLITCLALCAADIAALWVHPLRHWYYSTRFGPSRSKRPADL